MVRSLIRSIILSSRWLQIIMYFALVLVLVSIIYAIIRDSIELLINSGGVQGHYSEGLIISALTICELALLANLIVVVMVSGYQNFIDHIGSEKTNKGILWITGLDYTKVKAIILSSIVAISSVQLLKLFLWSDSTPQDMIFALITQIVFIFSILGLSLARYIDAKAKT